jgi:hypothetical protein
MESEVETEHGKCEEIAFIPFRRTWKQACSMHLEECRLQRSAGKDSQTNNKAIGILIAFGSMGSFAFLVDSFVRFLRSSRL